MPTVTISQITERLRTLPDEKLAVAELICDASDAAAGVSR